MNRAFEFLFAGFLLVVGGALLAFGSDSTSVVTNSALAEHLAQLRVPPGFTVVVQPPFVVVGDEPAEVVKDRADGTIKWAVEKLKQDYFTDDPKEILDIWLFKDAASYAKHTRLLFNDTPTTPYGYYSRDDKALIMNISTGGGTLVHEMMHFNVIASTDDWAYGQSAALSLAKSSPTKALDNSDNHEYFTENNPAKN